MADTVISRISHAMGKNFTSPPTPSNSNDSSPISSSLRHSTIRGFKLGENSTYYKGLPLAAQGESAKKKCATFTIGTPLGGEESPRRPNSNLSASRSKKKTSFKDEVAVGRAATHRLVFESDDEDEDVSESAIEDEGDSSGWEDSDCESGPSSVNGDELFERVDSKSNLTSQPSLLTTLMHEPDRAKALANAASRSTPHSRRSGRSTPNGPSVATSPEPNAQLPTSETANAQGRSSRLPPTATQPNYLSLRARYAATCSLPNSPNRCGRTCFGNGNIGVPPTLRYLRGVTPPTMSRISGSIPNRRPSFQTMVTSSDLTITTSTSA